MSSKNKHTSWKAGAASLCITPDEPLWLYGYTTQKRFTPSTGVLSDLYAKGLALEDPEGNRVLILTLDICGMRKPLARAVLGFIEGRTGIPQERILLNFSHTHSAPMVGCPISRRFPITGADRAATLAYTESLAPRVAEVALQALAALLPAELAYGKGCTDFVVNRRVLDESGSFVRMGPNPDGPVDPAVHALRVTGENGKLLAVLYGCACHNVTLGPTNLLISSDFSGFASAALEREHPGSVALFLTGCAADANPEPRGGPEEVELVSRHGGSLASEVERVLGGKLVPVRGPLHAAATTARLPLQAAPAREGLDALCEKGRLWHKRLNWERLREALDAGHPVAEHYPAPVSMWHFGDDLTLTGLPGEAVCEYALSAAKILQGSNHWIASYCHEVVGYIPSRLILEQGGYETLGLLSPGIGFFAPETESVLLETLQRLDERRP